MGCMESIPRVESIPRGYKVYMASNPHIPLNIESEEFILLECFCVIWSTSDRAHQELPSPEGYGWTLNTERKWSPVRTTFPLASKACTELVRCGCKRDRLWGKMYM